LLTDVHAVVSDKAQVERKIRLLSLSSLAFDNVGGDLAYSKIASVLETDVSEVERWVIDGMFVLVPSIALMPIFFPVIRAGLVSGKLSQTTQTLHISRATARTFEHAQWEALEKRLLAWKTGLAAVLDVVASATPKSGSRAVPGTDGHPASTESQPQAIAASA
jgi:translation initiation factor 3 subunit M